MPVVLPNTTTANTFPGIGAGGAQIGLGDKFDSGFFVVANAAAIGQYFHGVQGQGDESPEIFLPPGTYPLQGTVKDPLAGIRFKSAIAGTPAQVFGVLFYPDEAKLLSSSEFLSTVAATGGITPPGSAAMLATIVTRAANQAAGVGAMIFDTELYDTLNGFVIGTPTRITLTEAGEYFALGSIFSNGMTGTGQTIGSIQRYNSLSVLQENIATARADVINGQSSPGNAFRANPGDYIQYDCNQGATGAAGNWTGRLSVMAISIP